MGAREGAGREGGLLHVCITNIGQKNLPNRRGFYRVTFTKSTGLWRHGRGKDGRVGPGEGWAGG